VATLEFSPDGRWLVTVESDPNATDLEVTAGYAATVRIWDAAMGKAASSALRAPGHPLWGPHRPNDFFPKTVFSPDSARLTLLVTDGIALVWDIASDKAVNPLRLPDQRAVIKAFSSDGTRLVSLRGERILQVWDVASGEPLSPALETGIRVDTVHFSPDGSRLLAVGADGAELWPLSTEVRSAEEVMRHAQLLSGRQFDASGSITSATPETLTNLWHALQTRLATDSGVAPTQVRAWHERAVESCEQQKQWFAAAFHLDQLVKDRPDDNALRLRRRTAREKAEFEHLKGTR
jgi:WD40 repeat protein